MCCFILCYIRLHLFFPCMTIQWYRELLCSACTFNIYNFRGISRGNELQYQNVCRIMSPDPYMCFCSSRNCFTPSEQIVVALLLILCGAYVSVSIDNVIWTDSNVCCSLQIATPFYVFFLSIANRSFRQIKTVLKIPSCRCPSLNTCCGNCHWSPLRSYTSILVIYRLVLYHLSIAAAQTFHLLSLKHRLKQLWQVSYHRQRQMGKLYFGLVNVTGGMSSGGFIANLHEGLSLSTDTLPKYNLSISHLQFLKAV